MNPIEIMDLDVVLSDLGLGPYQITICMIMGLVIMYSSISPLSYALTASDVKYRCKIPQCDNDNPSYEPDWLNKTVPYNEKLHVPSKCYMFHYSPPASSGTDVFANDTCNRGTFNVSSIEKCDTWVFGETERTIVNDFDIKCEDNKWKLSMVGTVNSIGQLIGIPLSGYISDKYGRKSILIAGSVTSAIFGTVRSYTTDYNSFLVLEFIDSFASSGVYGVTFILGLELVSPKARVPTSIMIGTFYPVGTVIMGYVGYVVLDWRTMLRILYLPGLLILGCIWYVPESVRWLQTQNRIKEVVNVLSKVAESNRKPVPSSVKEALVSHTNGKVTNKIENKQLSCLKLIKKIINSKEIFLRLMNCSFCWISMTFVYYGLSLTSVEFSGNKYLNFILINAVEIPATFISWYLMEKFSRRHTQALAFFFSGTGCIGIILISADWPLLKLICFLFSKFSIVMAFNTMYVFTAEMFPTELRMSLFGIASSFGRMGSIFAAQMALLSANFGQWLPILLFGIMSFIAGALVYFFPETKDQKLPDTVAEAECVEMA